MTQKLDKFRSDLDIANYKMSELKHSGYDESYQSQLNNNYDSGKRTDSWKKNNN